MYSDCREPTQLGGHRLGQGDISSHMYHHGDPLLCHQQMQQNWVSSALKCLTQTNEG